MPRLGRDLALHLGTELGIGLEFGGPTIELPIQLTNLKAWFDSRTTAQMNASPETGIQTWTSRDGSMGAVALSQATPAARPVYVASVPQLGGKPGVQFDGVDDMLTALTAADWTFLHNGAGSTIFVVMRSDSSGGTAGGQYFLTTNHGASASNVGFYWYFVNGTTTGHRITNGSGSNLSTITSTAAGHFERDVPCWRAATHGAGVRKLYAQGAALVSQADGAGAASASPPANPLRVGNATAAWFKGWVAQILLYDRELSAAEINSLGAFFEAQYPEVPQQIPGLKCWFDSRTSAQMTLETGVRTWRSRAGSMGAAADLWQASSVAQPAYATSVAALGNRPAVLFDGDSLAGTTAPDWAFLHDGSGASIFLVQRIDSTGPALQVLFATTGAIATNTTGVYVNNTSGTSLLERIASGGGVAYTNSWSVTDASLISRDVSKWTSWGYSTGTQRSAASGVAVSNADTGPAPSSSSPNSPLRIGGTASAGTLKGHIAQIMVYDHVLTTEETASLAAWAAMEYGVAA